VRINNSHFSNNSHLENYCWILTEFSLHENYVILTTVPINENYFWIITGFSQHMHVCICTHGMNISLYNALKVMRPKSWPDDITFNALYKEVFIACVRVTFNTFCSGHQIRSKFSVNSHKNYIKTFWYNSHENCVRIFEILTLWELYLASPPVRIFHENLVWELLWELIILT
jgi:hypothetical protein